MDTTASFSADKALAEALARLVSVEEDNASLKSKLQQLATDARPTELPAKSGDGWSGGGQRDPEKLQKQIKEVCKLLFVVLLATHSHFTHALLRPIPSLC